MKKLKFITGNKSKHEEAREIISGLERVDYDLPEIQSLDPKEIISIKLEEAIKIQKGNFIVEDTSLFIESLNGFPGPLIKWFLKSLGNDGIYELVKDRVNKKVRVVCMIGMIYHGDLSFYKSEIKGEISKPLGENGFGWDPIFRPSDSKKTFGQMLPKEKEKYNMRVAALLKLKKALLPKRK